jgi:heptosyltransferase-2
MIRLGHQVILLGGPQDSEFGEVIKRTALSILLRHAKAKFDKAQTNMAGSKLVNFIGMTSLLVSAAIIKRCRLFIANDSGLMHIAEAVGTPLIAIFGSTTRELGFFPQRAISHVIENLALSCRPCSHLGRHQCPRGHFRCMREILPEQVIAKAQQILLSSRNI